MASKKNIIGTVMLALCVGAMFLYSPASHTSSVEQVEESYEKQARTLLAHLLLGKYEPVEQYFQQAEAAGRLPEHGRNAVYSVLNTWFDSDYYLTDDTLKHINGWIATYPDSAFAYMARAEFYYKNAWKSRTGRWAALVTEDGYRGYYSGLGQAHADITNEVLPRNPAMAYAYARLIAIAAQTNGYFDAQREQTPDQEFLASVMKAVSGKLLMHAHQQQLLEQAKANNVTDMFGIHKDYMFFSLSPQWGGSAELMLAYARRVSEAVPADSTLPMLRVTAHSTLARGSHDQKKAYYAQPGVWEEVKWAYDRVNAAYPQGAQWMVIFAETAYDAGKYKLSGTLMNQAYYTDPNYTRSYLEIGKMYMKNKNEYGYAEKAYKELLALRKDHPDPYRQIGYIRIQQGKYDEALDWLNKGLKVDDANCLLLAHRCLVQLKKQNYPQALADCSYGTQKDPYCRQLYMHRAKVHRAMGNEQEALADEAINKQLKAYN